jgi:hypothetical protein
VMLRWMFHETIVVADVKEKISTGGVRVVTMQMMRGRDSHSRVPRDSGSF